MAKSKPTMSQDFVDNQRKRNIRNHLVEKGRASTWLPRYDIDEAWEKAGLP
jgi:hypothetical protein